MRYIALVLGEVTGDMREKLAIGFKILVLLLSVANVSYQVFLIWRGHGSWVSLGLFIYGIVALGLLVCNSIAFMLPGRRSVPVASLVVIVVGFLLFIVLPHHVVMF